MPMCLSRVLFGLESSARARSRDRLSRADVFDSSPVGGCKYKKYVLYISTDEQHFWKTLYTFSETGIGAELLVFPPTA